MAIKIDTNQSAIAHHIVDGATVFPYAVDAHNAVSNHPLEWSETPWHPTDAAAARARINERNQASGAELLPEPEPLSPEDQASLDEYNKAVADAAKRLADYHAKKAAEKELADQVAADEALVASPPPRPDPSVRRPTPAQIRKAAAELSGEETAALKAEEDRIGNAINKIKS